MGVGKTSCRGRKISKKCKATKSWLGQPEPRTRDDRERGASIYKGRWQSPVSSCKLLNVKTKISTSSFGRCNLVKLAENQQHVI